MEEERNRWECKFWLFVTEIGVLKILENLKGGDSQGFLHPGKGIPGQKSEKILDFVKQVTDNILYTERK